MPAFTANYQAERAVPALPTIPYLTHRLCVRLYNSLQIWFYLLITENTEHLHQFQFKLFGMSITTSLYLCLQVIIINQYKRLYVPYKHSFVCHRNHCCLSIYSLSLCICGSLYN